MCNPEKMIDHSSLTSIIIIRLFRASLLFVALLSTFYAHFSFSLPLFSVLVVSSFLFLNIMFVCKKMTSYKRTVQAKRLPENEVTRHKGLQNGDEKVLDQSQITDFTISNVFEPDLIIFDDLDKKGDNKSEFAPTSSNTLASNLSLNLCDESISEDAEEDYLIEIPLSEQRISVKERERHNLETELLDLLPESVLQEEGIEDFLSDMNEIGGEDNLIEIDISMGSIRHSGSECEITT